MMHTIEEAQATFTYDDQTGELTRIRTGRVVGHANTNGYLQVYFGGRYECVHKIVWLLHTGEWPEFIVDHRDTNKKNNRFGNLRKANAVSNQHNVGLRKDNSTGYKGVQRRHNGFVAMIRVNKQRVYLGYFKTAEEAGKAYEYAAREVQGEFAHTGAN